MAEYFEREAAVKAFNNFDAGRTDSPPCTLLTPEEFAEYLYELPTADVVPVVRCKDCTHYDMGVCLKIYSDGNVHPEAWQSRRPEDFCSYGERKDEGAENG